MTSPSLTVKYNRRIGEIYICPLTNAWDPETKTVYMILYCETEKDPLECWTYWEPFCHNKHIAYCNNKHIHKIIILANSEFYPGCVCLMLLGYGDQNFPYWLKQPVTSVLGDLSFLAIH